MNKSILALSVATALLLSGCGSGEGVSGGSAVSTVTTDIIVERGPVLKATTRDAKGQIGVSKGNGVYSFTDPEYPIESFGGYIDMNRNGIVDAGDLEMKQLRLRTNAGTVMTMATTMVENNETLHALLEDGFSEDELLEQRPSTDIDNAALSDESYKYCIDNNITDPLLLSRDDIESLRERIKIRREAYNGSEKDSQELEYELVNDELEIETIREDEIPDVELTPDETILNAIPLSNLTLEQKSTLAYMWDEERLARDIYLALNELTHSQTLYNIATNSESKHVESVEDMIERYNLNLLNPTDFSGGYSEDALEAIEDRVFLTPELTTLYSELYAKGANSLQDALEVGCMVEVTDINDLNRDIVTAGEAEDLVMLFENLRNGSYSHYWAFDKALKGMGVSEGCCGVGDEYCKTTEEYPQPDNGSQNSGSGTGEGNKYQHGKN